MSRRKNQRGEEALAFLLSLALLAFIGMVIWYGISGVWKYIRTTPSSARIAAQASLADTLNISFDQYIHNACQQEATCRRYERSRSECATAGNIKECIKIKMRNEDYSACEDEDFYGVTSDTSNILPTYHQCISEKIARFFGNSDESELPASPANAPKESDKGAGAVDSAPKILPPAAGSSMPSSDQWFWWSCPESTLPTLAAISPYPDCEKTAAPNSFDRVDSSAASNSTRARAAAPSSSDVDISSLPPPPAWLPRLNSSASSAVAKTHTENTAPDTDLSRQAELGKRGTLAVLREAAEQGDANAQDALANMHRLGLGVPKNYVVAAHWYWKSAEQGNPDAQFELGMAYLTGRGIPPDPVKSYKWLYLASRSAYLAADEANMAAVELKVTELTPAQIAQAQSEAAQWLKTHRTH